MNLCNYIFKFIYECLHDYIIISYISAKEGLINNHQTITSYTTSLSCHLCNTHILTESLAIKL